MLKVGNWLNRAVLPHGETGAAVGIPADVRRELEVEPGEDGDSVDLEYDRETRTLTVHFPDPDENRT
jgi:hypothetical protein